MFAAAAAPAMLAGVDVPPPASPFARTIAGTRKPIVVARGGRFYSRRPVKSRLVVAGDDLGDLIDALTANLRRPTDTIVISEKALATSEGRAIPVDEIQPGPLARVLWRFVRKVPYGIGLRSPETMQCAIDECGAARILLASVAGAVGKLFGRRGDFYRVAGMQAATIDAAGTSAIPQLASCVVLGPRDPESSALALAAVLRCEVAIVDVNDIGGSRVLGASDGVDRDAIEDILRDNPLGQGDELTPFGIIREVTGVALRRAA